MSNQNATLHQEIIQLLTRTYSSSSTQQIKEATEILMIKRKQRKFIPTIQNILKSKQTNHSTKLAAANTLKTLIETELFEAQYAQQKKQLLIGAKAYIVNQINEIIRDQNIIYLYKAYAIDGYVIITLMDYGTNNLQKIIRDMKFYYKIQQQILSVLFTSSILKCKYLNIRYETELYQQTFPMLLQTFEKFAKLFYGSYNPNQSIYDSQTLWKLNETLEILNTVIQNVKFAQFPMLPVIYLQNENFIRTLDFFCLEIGQSLRINQQVVKNMHIIIQNDIIRKHQITCNQILFRLISQGFRINLQGQCQKNMAKIVNIVEKMLFNLQDQILSVGYAYNNENLNKSIVSAIRVIRISIKTRLQLILNQKDTKKIANLVNIQWLINSTTYLIQKFIERQKFTQSTEEYTFEQEYCQFFNFWDDAVNQGQSQIIQIQFNNLLLAYVQNNIDGTIKEYLELIKPYTQVSFQRLHCKQQNESQSLKVSNFPSNIPNNPFNKTITKSIVRSISQSDKKARNMMLLMPSLLLKIFMQYPHVERQIQTLILNNYHRILLSEEYNQSDQRFQQLVMFLMLIYNYGDDILQEESSNQIYTILIQQAFKIDQLIQNHTFHVQKQRNLNRKNLLLAKIYAKIMHRYFSYDFPYASQIKKIGCFLDNMNQKVSLAMIQVLSVVIRNYSSDISQGCFVQQIIRKLMKKIVVIYNQTMEQDIDYGRKKLVTSLLTSRANSLLVKLLPQFKNFKYSQLLDNIKEFVTILSRKNGLGSQLKVGFHNIFPLLKKSISVLKQIPPGYQNLIYQCQISIQDRESFQALNMFIIYAKQNCQQHFKFVRKIVQICLGNLQKFLKRKISPQKMVINQKRLNNKSKQESLDLCQLHSLLLLHIGIYYHHQHFDMQFLEEIVVLLDLQFRLKEKQFDFIQGKYQLIIIMLLRFQFEKIHFILKKISERQKLQQTNNQQAMNGNSNHQKNMVTYQLIYNVLYYNQNVYRVEYDATVFVTCQLEILQNFLKPNVEASIMMYKYAHISLLSIIWNIERIYRSKIEKQGHDDLLDCQQLIPQVGLQKDFHSVLSSIKIMQLPLANKNSQMDEFQKFNAFQKKLFSTKQGVAWYETMIQKYLSQETKVRLNNIREYKKVNGNYRKIYSVHKKMKQQHMQPSYQNQRKLFD